MSPLLLPALLAGAVALSELTPNPSPPEGSGDALVIMSFNIRYGAADDGEDSWPGRKEVVARVIGDSGADLVGVQEALVFQLRELSEELPSMGWVGAGRDDGIGGGEYAAILYRRERLRLLESGTFWFSDTPTRPGSASWGNEIPRICTWARFENPSTGSDFALFNVHWDHQSQASRERSAALLLDKIRELGVPLGRVLVTGDFNAGEENPAFLSLLSDTDVPLQDSFRVLHPHATGVGTFHGFRGGIEGEKIDAVLVGVEWKVVEAAIVRRAFGGRYPSDHYPVTATLELVAGEGRRETPTS